MPAKHILIGGLVAGLLAVAGPARAQLDASERPDTRGPLTTGPPVHECQSRVERFQGEAAGRFRICYWYFMYDPARESSQRFNYAGFWAQGTITPLGQWCARRAHLDLDLPRRGVLKKAPHVGTRVSRAGPFRTRLEVDAQGNGEGTAVIANTFRVLEDRLDVVRVDGGRVHRMKWAGGTGSKLAFASGVELQFRPGAQLPRVDPRLFAFLSRTGTC